MSADTPFQLPLDSADATLQVVGGKGVCLARMATAGLPVPPGFHVTTAAYRRFVEANALPAVIAEATADAQPDDPASLERASAAVRRLFQGGAAPEAVAAAIHAAYTSLGAAEPTEAAPAVAVRSSATAEDLPGLSFAGQYDSYLNVRGESALLAAVRGCWASLWTVRAISYRLRNGIDQRAVAMAVVVQRLVPSEASPSQSRRRDAAHQRRRRRAGHCVRNGGMDARPTVCPQSAAHHSEPDSSWPHSLMQPAWRDFLARCRPACPTRS